MYTGSRAFQGVEGWLRRPEMYLELTERKARSRAQLCDGTHSTRVGTDLASPRCDKVPSKSEERKVH